MNKKNIYKSYIYFSRTVLLLGIYVIFFPIISKPIKAVFPSFGKCAYLTLTGNPCPLCGGTRYIENLGQVLKDWHYLLNPFGIMIVFIILEIIFRIIILTVYKKRKKENKLKINHKLIIIDEIIHILVAIIFIIYEIIFIQIY